MENDREKIPHKYLKGNQHVYWNLFQFALICFLVNDLQQLFFCCRLSALFIEVISIIRLQMESLESLARK